MHTCKSCGAEISDTWVFCQTCGKKVSDATDSHRVVGSNTQASTRADTHTQKSADTSSQKSQGDTDRSTVPIPIEPKEYLTVPLHVIEQEDEAERRKRIAMLDPEFAALDEQSAKDAALLSPLADITTHENIPLVAGTPHINNVVQIQGTPQFRGGGAGYGTMPAPPYAPAGPPSGMGHNAGSMGNQVSSHMVAARPIQRSPETPLPPSLAATPPYSYQKWLRIGLISGLILVILLLSGMGIALITSTPALSLDGGTTIAQGGTLHLNGSHFLANNTVTLTLDQTTPLYSAHHDSEEKIASNHLYIMNTLLFNNKLTQTPSASNTIRVNSDGTFSANIQVGLDWKPGEHSIQANEASGARSASLSFTVMLQTPVSYEMTVTPETATDTNTPITVTSSPDTSTSITTTVTPPTLVTSGLSGVTPNILTFGPANEGDQQATTSVAVLNTTGTALLAWNATWDQKQAPWLQMQPATGRIQAPASQKIAVSASPANLKAGIYKALITFSNALNAQTVSLSVTLTIQAGCLKVAPSSLAFAGTAGAADPAPQTVTLSNCGQASKWSAVPAANSSWLSVKPATGTLAPNGTQDVVVTATSQKLATGSYQSQIVFSDGNSQVMVPVTLTVQAAAQLNVSQPNIAVARSCTLSAATWTCTETLSSTQGNLAWTSTSNAKGTVTMTPAGGTIASGQTTAVSIVIPTAACAANFTLTFTGPANSVDVPIDCSNLQPTT